MKTIGVAGSQLRIGTTTQALQMVLCFMELGHDAAYIEMGKQGYLEDLKSLYKDVSEDPKTHAIICNNIQMYSSKNIVEAYKQSYDYIVKDYGSIKDPSFEKISFLEQDIKIVICGTKANEIYHVEEILEQKCYEDVRYLFNFVPQEDQQDIKALMGEKGENTYFSIYAPNPFAYVENECYSYLLGG